MDFIGPRFEHAPYFPDRINTEFIRVVNPNTIKMRVWERGSGETLACGTGACAAVVAAVANGLCSKGSDITVRVRGGDLVVNYTDEKVTLTGDAGTGLRGCSRVLSALSSPNEKLPGSQWLPGSFLWEERGHFSPAGRPSWPESSRRGRRRGSHSTWPRRPGFLWRGPPWLWPVPRQTPEPLPES